MSSINPMCSSINVLASQERATLTKGRLEHGLPRAPLSGCGAAQRQIRRDTGTPRPADLARNKPPPLQVRARLAVLGPTQLVSSGRWHLQQRPLRLPAAVDGVLVPPAAAVPSVHRRSRLGLWSMRLRPDPIDKRQQLWMQVSHIIPKCARARARGRLGCYQYLTCAHRYS